MCSIKQEEKENGNTFWPFRIGVHPAVAAGFFQRTFLTRSVVAFDLCKELWQDFLSQSLLLQCSANISYSLAIQYRSIQLDHFKDFHSKTYGIDKNLHKWYLLTLQMQMYKSAVVLTFAMHELDLAIWFMMIADNYRVLRFIIIENVNSRRFLLSNWKRQLIRHIEADWLGADLNKYSIHF